MDSLDLRARVLEELTSSALPHPSNPFPRVCVPGCQHSRVTLVSEGNGEKLSLCPRAWSQNLCSLRVWMFPPFLQSFSSRRFAGFSCLASALNHSLFFELRPSATHLLLRQRLPCASSPCSPSSASEAGHVVEQCLDHIS